MSFSPIGLFLAKRRRDCRTFGSYAFAAVSVEVEKERLLLVFPFSIGSESSIASSYKCFVLEPSEERSSRKGIILSKVFAVSSGSL